MCHGIGAVFFITTTVSFLFHGDFPRPHASLQFFFFFFFCTTCTTSFSNHCSVYSDGDMFSSAMSKSLSAIVGKPHLLISECNDRHCHLSLRHPPPSASPSFTSSHLAHSDRIPLLVLCHSVSSLFSFCSSSASCIVVEKASQVRTPPPMRDRLTSSYMYLQHVYFLAEVAEVCWCEDSSPAGGRAWGDRGHALADGGARHLPQPWQQLDRQPQQPGDCGRARGLHVPLQVQCSVGVILAEAPLIVLKN